MFCSAAHTLHNLAVVSPYSSRATPIPPSQSNESGIENFWQLRCPLLTPSWVKLKNLNVFLFSTGWEVGRIRREKQEQRFFILFWLASRVNKKQKKEPIRKDKNRRKVAVFRCFISFDRQCGERKRTHQYRSLFLSFSSWLQRPTRAKHQKRKKWLDEETGRRKGGKRKEWISTSKEKKQEKALPTAETPQSHQRSQWHTG